MSKYWVEKQQWQRFPRVLNMCKDDGIDRKFVRYVREDEAAAQADELRAIVADIWPRASLTMCEQTREEWAERLAAAGVGVGA